MKFYTVTGKLLEGEALEAEWKNSRQIGALRIADRHLFFRTIVKLQRKDFCISYDDIRRCYRRVMLVPARMCCGRGDLEMEHLVIEDDTGEVAEIAMPGTRAAKEAIAELRGRIPGALFTCPEKTENTSERTSGKSEEKASQT